MKLQELSKYNKSGELFKLFFLNIMTITIFAGIFTSKENIEVYLYTVNIFSIVFIIWLSIFLTSTFLTIIELINFNTEINPYNNIIYKILHLNNVSNDKIFYLTKSELIKVKNALTTNSNFKNKYKKDILCFVEKEISRISK